MMAAYTRRRVVGGIWRSEVVDDIARVIKILNDLGKVVETVPFNAAQNAEADRRDAQLAEVATELAITADVRQQLQAMRATIGAGDAPAGTETLNAIINTPNAAINQSSAQYVKALARLVRELTRVTIRLARLTIRDLNTPAE